MIWKERLQRDINEKQRVILYTNDIYLNNAMPDQVCSERENAAWRAHRGAGGS
jgi:hypothetical protein